MSDITEKLKADYDAVAYESAEHYHAHPDRISVTAALRGLVPPPVNNCRVLEIACAWGGNLLPMAEQMPEGQFLGIDLSPRQVESGAAIIRELGLTNIEIRCQDLMEFPEDAGTFDYIIAHGFYSWVPDPVRRKLMQVCQRHLSENGLAYISYNVLPGWQPKGVIREMMLYHARNTVDPAERIKRGREMVQMVAENTPNTAYYRDLVREFQKAMLSESDSYLLHDHMAVINEAVYLRDFVGQAESFGLAHLGDAFPRDDFWNRIPAAMRETISRVSADAMEREQYLDFLTNRMFRRSVLCRSEAAKAAVETAASQIPRLHVSGYPTETPLGTNAEGKLAFQFGTAQDKVQLFDPRPVAALRLLCRAWPLAVPFSELVAAASAQVPVNPQDPQRNAIVLARVIETCLALNIIELWTRPTDHISATPGEKPRAPRWARWQASHSASVTSLRHTPVKVDDIIRHLLPLIDGSRDRQALAEELARRNIAAGAAEAAGVACIRDSQRARQMFDNALPVFAKLGLLVG